jgi:hypothetical protein
MIPLLIGAFAVAGAGIGWVGYKANVRIAEWGRNMNECDRIFQMAAEGEGDPDQPMVRSRSTEDGRAKTPFVGQHMPTGPAASR